MRRWSQIAAAVLAAAAAACTPAGAMAAAPDDTIALPEFTWRAGAEDCTRARPPPLEVHRVASGTWVLRENPCTSPSAPFMYLLAGSARALLIDTGDVADADDSPLAKTVLALLPGPPQPLPLWVVHTHAHAGGRNGDALFTGLPNVTLTGTALADVQKAFGIVRWPEGTGTIDLGGRAIEVLPTPGHGDADVSYYDPQTAMLFAGEFLQPARLRYTDRAAARASARRLADYFRERPVGLVLGARIELARTGELQVDERYRPDEMPLPIQRADLMHLPEMLAGYNGVYTRSGALRMMNPNVLLAAKALGALLALAVIAWGARAWWRERREENARLGRA